MAPPPKTPKIKQPVRSSPGLSPQQRAYLSSLVVRPASSGIDGISKWAAYGPRTDITFGRGSGSASSIGQDTGGGVLSKLKTFGEGALNTLSVPQAMLFTLGSKTIEGLSGRKGMDWTDALGGFSDGYKGYREILEQVGVPKDSAASKWGGLAGDIVLDPLWFVAPAKVARTPKTVEKAVEVVRGADNISKDAGTAAMLSKFAKGTPKPPPPPVKIPRVKHTLEVGQGNVGVSATARATGKAQGYLMDGKYFIHRVAHRSHAKGGKKAEWRVFEIADPAMVAQTDVKISKHFKSLKEAEDFVRTRVREVPEGQSIEPKMVNLEDAGTVPLRSIDEWTNRKIAEAVKRHEKGNLGIKFGVGKPNPQGGRSLTGSNFTVRTNLPYPGKTLGALNSSNSAMSFFKRTPFAKEAHRLTTSARELKQAAEVDFRTVVRDTFGLTDQEAKAVWHAMLGDQNTLGRLEGVADPAIGVGSDVGAGLTSVFTDILKQQGKWSEKQQQVLDWAQQRLRDHWSWLNRKPDKLGRTYTPQGPTDKWIEEVTKAQEPSGLRALVGRGPRPTSQGSRKHESAWNYWTKEEYVQQLMKDTGLDEESARIWADFAEQRGEALRALSPFNKRSKNASLGFRSEADSIINPRDSEAIPFDPETDLFVLLGRAEGDAVAKKLDQQINQLAVAAGLGEMVPKTKGKKTKMKFEARDGVAAREVDRAKKTASAGPVASNDFARKFQKVMAYVKGTLTTLNVQHFFGNLLGDYPNSLVRGNIRHAKFPTANVLWAGSPLGRPTKGSKYAKIASRDRDALENTVIKIGGQEYTGAEIYMLSHMMGLGKGYSGEEVAAIINMGKAAEGAPVLKQFKQYWRFMQRQNMTREDAVRLQAWVRHMESGDNPIEAMYKMLDGIFDYGDMTDFEKIVLRNVILFYTWMRKNTAFQIKGLVKKPALYNAYGAIERDREKMPFEPDYMSRMGLIPIPGFGQINVMAPYTDLYKIPLLSGQDWRDSFRREFMSSAIPPIKQIGELATNRDFFTGGDLVQFEGQSKQSPFPFLDRALNALGITDPARMQKGGELVPAMPARWAYFLKQFGPVASQSGRLLGDSGPSYSNPIDALGQITGFPRRVVPNPDWERQAAVRAAKRKADDTRSKNQHAANPKY